MASLFFFPTSVYIRRKRGNVDIENTTHLMNVLKEIIQEITAQGGIKKIAVDYFKFRKQA